MCRYFSLFALAVMNLKVFHDCFIEQNVAHNVSSKLLVILYAHKLTSKPKNARSKRALDARQPKEIEDARTTIFIKGTHTGEVLNSVMRELVSVIRYFHSNTIYIFELFRWL